MIILYHANCPDGFTAAWAAWRRFGDSASYRAVNYSDPLPSDVDGHEVMLVDFSFTLPMMEELSRRASGLTVFDHHKTAWEALRNFHGGRVVFDMARSGAGITWDELHPSPENWQGIRPRLISYVEDRDLWRWNLPSSRQVSEYIFAVERTFENWDQLSRNLEEKFEQVVDRGTTLLHSKRVRVATVCANARILTFNGLAVPVVNHAWDMSEVGEHLCEQFPSYPCAGYYFDRKDKRQWGFRSRGDFDVSALCNQFGGGGHKNAAGFESEIGWLPTIQLKEVGDEPGE